MNKTVTAEQMINYLQEMLTDYMEDVEKHGNNIFNRYKVQQAIACKEMVEALIQEPVNLQKDGKVTIGL